ncbi:gp106 [Bacillus phage G]|uniref:Gp106 n=1 Tax=Bacillus phage G TaxID=2884420 RepID=G3MBG8_9CAUD|nr:gp106 [Bacillus phage G]AEO93368.1 gp106 [Bacillus phage G]
MFKELFMSDKNDFHRLFNSLDIQRIMDTISEKKFKSILEVDINYKKIPTGKKFLFFQRKEMIFIFKFKVNEELSIIEHMTKGLNFQELTKGCKYEIEYV